MIEIAPFGSVSEVTTVGRSMELATHQPKPKQPIQPTNTLLGETIEEKIHEVLQLANKLVNRYPVLNRLSQN